MRRCGSEPGAERSQFFSNGGSDCYVVRLANGAQPAQITLLEPRAVSVATERPLQGSGERLSVTVDYNTPTPDTTFNLHVIQRRTVQTESFSAFRWIRFSAVCAQLRYAVFALSARDRRRYDGHGIAAGYSEARALVVPTGMAGTPRSGCVASRRSGSFQISVDGGPWTPINLSKTAITAAGPTDAGTFAYLQVPSICPRRSPGTSVTVLAMPTIS